ncbi:hypothetical protein ATCM_12450 [Stenotrophomonas sp. ATCM1_4]|nr:hypothetical protein ATCM_12450 [Stenotrophomonas sp. ATCM1_4]
MELPRAEPGQLIVTPHPMLLDGQRNTVWEARPGESLYALLMRNVPELDGQPWAVSVGGLPVERHLWHHVYPKAGQVIEVRGGVGRSALAVVAMIALTYFTFGGGAIAGFTLGTSTALGTLAVQSAVYIAGSMLINKVLAPKPPKAVGQQQDSVYSITGARNQLRPYDPLPLLFGRVRLTPDLLSKPYTWYEGNDQYLGMLLCAGINVGRVEEFYNGDTLLSTYEGAQVFHAGYSQMPEQAIPLYSNADVIDGGQLIDTGSDPKHQPSAWVERTGSADTVRLVVAIEYQLYDKTSKGKDKNNTERVEIQYRPTGTTSWLSFGSYTLNSNKTKLHRVGYAKDVARGQYDVRVRTAGLNTNGSGAQAVFAWTTLTSVQVDEADYTGISRTGVKLKATGQLNGSPDELRAIGHADPIPVWTGTEWATQETSNPGAQILAYARGIVREGRLLGGMALSDAQIDIESLKAFSLHCAANGYRYDFLIKDARNHDQVLAAIALAGFGQITWAGGRLGVVWAAQEQPLSGVVNMATIKKGQFQVDYTLSNAADGIEYTYADGTTWETKTIRVPAPGVTTMLNPAQVTGEGVTTEEHAARLARWHLAQSLYQYKDISYSTDIEHLSYQRLSLLAMQHDMTQWGFGGRVRAVLVDGAPPPFRDVEVEKVRFVDGQPQVFTQIERVAFVPAGSTVSLILDEPVPAPSTSSVYFGLRIPGERVYRVLRVKPFTGQTDTIELLDAWPTDAALPGSAAGNPAHDTIWIYDFKQTPGLRVRVVSVEPESDLKGASVRVVAEGPEFWNYVLTGHYVPSPDGSLLQTRPVASNVAVTEQLVVQGNTVFTELTATFDVTGPVGNIIVQATGQEGELREVAQTRTRTATWRIPQADVYTIIVRPYSPEGEAGVAVSKTYATIGADVPPVLVDLFDVQERSGGVRLYTWGWLQDTIQSADFAGVEIRYVAGTVAAPVWEDMTPVGDSGFHTAAFEAVVPEAGDWTFACRSRNTSGELSTGMQILHRTLAKNLGQALDEITAEQAAQQSAIEAAEHAAALAELKAAKSLALMGTEYAAEEGYAADTVVYKDGRMYRAVKAVPVNQPPPNAEYWADVGTVTEAQGGTATALQQLRTDLDDQGEEFAAAITQVSLDAPSGSGNLLAGANLATPVAWDIIANSTGGTPDVQRQTGGTWMPPGMFGFQMVLPGPTGVVVYASPEFDVTPQAVYMASAWLADQQAGSGVYIVFYDGPGGGYCGETPSAVVPRKDGGTSLRLYDRVSSIGAAPAAARRGRLAWIVQGTSNPPYAWLVRPMVEEAVAGKSTPSAWSESAAGLDAKYASVTQALSVGIDGVDGRLKAKQTLATDVNGRWIGSVTENDGLRGGTTFIMDYFRLLAADGAAASIEITGNYLRVFNASYQKIIGVGFGVGGALMEWFGPNIGAANCTTANCIECKTTAGQTIIRGSNAQGAMEIMNTLVTIWDNNNVKRAEFGLLVD